MLQGNPWWYILIHCLENHGMKKSLGVLTVVIYKKHVQSQVVIYHIDASRIQTSKAETMCKYPEHCMIHNMDHIIKMRQLSVCTGQQWY